MNYRTTTLDTFVTLQRGYDLPSQDRVLGDIPVIAANGRVGFHNVSKVETECVVLGRSGSVGNPQLITEPFWPLNTTLYVKDFHGNSPTFVYYVLKTIDFKSFDAGGTVPTLNRNHLTQIQVPIVDSARQEVIGGVLHSLDSKIAANEGLAKTLEDIAQTIFKSWFIDFDPVKAKIAGEKPLGMDFRTASLFPDSFVESDLGEIPVGWEVVPSTDMFEILSGGTPKTSNEEYWNGDIPWFSVVDTPNDGGCFFIKTAKTITQDGLRNSAAKLVRPGITVISARGTVGKTAIAATQSTFNQSCYGVEGKYGDFLTYLLLKNQISRLQNISHGGMFDTITRETFSSVFVAKPSSELMALFESIVEPMFLEIRTRQFQNQELSEIRDALLPRLVSGELQIPEKMLA